jgi:predicted dehydrogenase
LTQRERGWGRWRYYRETGNGFTADWGAHNYDIAQAAIGMDGSGPCEFIPAGYRGTQYSTMKYQNGIVMTEQNYRPENEQITAMQSKGGGQGICFNGTKGWIKVARGFIECSDPSLVTRQEREVGAGQFESSSPHNQNFIDCVRSRKEPIAPVEVGASTLRVCVLANIANELRRPVKWNPATLTFEGGDIEAENHRLYHYQYRKPYSYKV